MRPDDTPVWQYAFSNLPAGPAILNVTSGSGGEEHWIVSKRVDLTIPPGGSLREEVNMEGGATVRGIIRGLAPGDSARVYALHGEFSKDDWMDGRYDMGTDFCANIPVARNGSFAMSGFQPRVYTLVALTYSAEHRQGFQSRLDTKIVEITGEDVDVSFALR